MKISTRLRWICQMGVNGASRWQAKCIYLYFNKFLVQVISIFKKGRGNCLRCILRFLTVDLQSCFDAVLPGSHVLMLFFLVLLLRAHGDNNMSQFSTQGVPWTFPDTTRKSEKCSPDQARAPLKSEAHVLLCTWWAPANPQWGFFTSYGTQISGKHSGGSGLLSDFEHKGLCEWPQSWAKLEVKTRALCHCPHQSVPTESPAGIMQPRLELIHLLRTWEGWMC